MPEYRIEDEDRLDDCCTDGGTSCATTFFCSSFTPTIITAFRMGWKGVAVGVGVLFVIFLVCCASLILAAITADPNQASDSGSSTDAMTADDYIHLSIFVAILKSLSLMVVLCCMRTSILKRYGRTDTDFCKTCLQALCCAPCLAAQMMRWTDSRYEKYNSVSKADIEMPVGPGKELV